MAPFDAVQSFGEVGSIIVYLALGVGFGFILESSGFGDARKLAGQFYFRDLTVVRVMFTGIVTAMLLTFAATALGWMDFEQVWVNPTFLPSVALGGALFGVGFVIGGYCPGTALVSAGTLKLDGILFVGGVLLGVFVYGETGGAVANFMAAGDYGRFTVADLFGVGIGTAALLVVALAVVMMWGLGRIARLLGYERAGGPRGALAGAAVAVAAALALIVAGQPSIDEKWETLAGKYQPRLDGREVYIDPGELATLMGDDGVKLAMLDVRGEADWNLYHLADAERVDAGDVAGLRGRIEGLPEGAVVVVMSNDESAATLAWKRLMMLGAPNAYILEGGINRWIEVFALAAHDGGHTVLASHGGPQAPAPIVPLEGTPEDERLRYRFAAALGERQPAAHLDPHHAPAREFTGKVKMQKKGKKSGGCG